VDNVRCDTSLADMRQLKGTEVYFQIKQRTRKDLATLFRDYSRDEFEFDTTKVTVHLTDQIDGGVSRSQARRLLVGLHEFKYIILDFAKVTALGQAFADEIIRVFPLGHSDVKMEPINMSPAISFVVKRALAHGAKSYLHG